MRNVWLSSQALMNVYYLNLVGMQTSVYYIC
ncbi:Uncharacterised protein [Vibrio cholerae]|nr:Uncharacterised protein [Vibrio cholerae]